MHTLTPTPPSLPPSHSLTHLTTDIPESRHGVVQVPQLDILRLMKCEENIAGPQREVGERLVLDDAYQTRQ